MNIYKSIGLACLLTYTFHAAPVQAVNALPGHPFVDMAGSFAEDAVSFLYQQGFVSGVSDDAFGPNQAMNRKHFTLLLAQAIGLQPVFPTEATFLDVPADSPEYGYIEAVHQLDLMNGIGPQQFGADRPITRQDVAVILYKVLGNNENESSLHDGIIHYKDHKQIKPYAQEAVLYVTTKGIMTDSKGLFYPNKPITRAESAVLCQKAVEKMNERAASQEWIVFDKITLKPGESKEIKLQHADGPIPFLHSWGLDHSEIGSISADGLFTAKQPGTAVISLNIGTKTYPIKVEVKEGEQP